MPDPDEDPRGCLRIGCLTILAAFGLIFATTFYCMFIGPKHPFTSFPHAFSRVVRHSIDGEFKFSSITDFEWDSVHLFTSYTIAREINYCLGFDWPDAWSVESQLRSDYSRVLVFVHNKTVVRQYDMTSILGFEFEKDLCQIHRTMGKIKVRNKYYKTGKPPWSGYILTPSF